MLFSVEAGEELVRGGGGFRIVQWAEVAWRCTTQEFHHEDSLLFLWQGFEGAEKFSGLPTHDS